MRVTCCFCGEQVEGAQAISMAVSDPALDGGTQALTCHSSCLDDRLHPSVPRLLD